jgi:hypothetical protein
MGATFAALDAHTPVVDADPQGRVTGFVSTYFRKWLLTLTDRLQRAAYVIANVYSLTGQNAALATHAVYTTTAAGLYRVSFVVRVTQAATTSSSLTVTLGWTRSAIALTAAGSAIVNGGVTSVQSGSVLMRAASATDLTVAVAYASVGATPMLWEIDVVVEFVS